MRNVKLYWKVRLTKSRKRDVVECFKKIYDEVKDEGEFLKIKAPNHDTKFLWLFMLSKAFTDLQ